jgi:hypothetical protein
MTHHPPVCAAAAACRRILSILLFSLIVASLSTRGNAQPSVVGADWFERPVAEGVTWKYYLFDNLYGGWNSITILEADLNAPGIETKFNWRASSRALTSTMAAEVPNAVAAINGTFFDTSAGGGGSTTYFKANGVVLKDTDGEGGILIANDGTVSIMARPAGGWNTRPEPFIMTNGPHMITNGAIVNLASNAHNNNLHPRTAVGLTADNRLLMVVVDGRMNFARGISIHNLAKVMLDLGAVDAFSLDGGGSSTAWVAGEPFSGVVNYPSDNGLFDHLGQRACANIIAVTTTLAASPLALDAKLESLAYGRNMYENATQTVTATYRNIGTQTWTQADTFLSFSKPFGRTSVFAPEVGSTLSVLNQASVATGQVGTFTFDLTAPSVTEPRLYHEFAALMNESVGRFGPSDSELRMDITVRPESPGGGNINPIIIECRSGGQNFLFYSEEGGFADSVAAYDYNVLTDLTPSIGHRYGSTFRTVAGLKKASFAPEIPASGMWEVYTAIPNGGSRKNPITYTIKHNQGETKILINQADNNNINKWIKLGEFEFFAGGEAALIVSNEDINESGNMYPGAAKFVYIPPPVKDTLTIH